MGQKYTAIFSKFTSNGDQEALSGITSDFPENPFLSAVSNLLVSLSLAFQRSLEANPSRAQYENLPAN